MKQNWHPGTRWVVAYLLLLDVLIVVIIAAIYKLPALEWSALQSIAGAALVAGVVTFGRFNVSYCWFSSAHQSVAWVSACAWIYSQHSVGRPGSPDCGDTASDYGVRVSPRSARWRCSTSAQTWQEVLTQNRRVVAGVERQGTWASSYHIIDRELGWTIGSNRQSRDGLYFSSFEGIRSEKPNVRFSAQTPRFRVALIGDSNVFSLEVPFEESWSHFLQRQLGNDVQILNFGVDGYAIDQMYLRYKRDVRPWNADVVVIGFIEHNLLRSLAVYPFASFGWPGFMVKPRFTANSGQLTLLNLPLPSPAEILNTKSADQLPFIEYDWGYHKRGWYWRRHVWPYILRFAISRFPPSPLGPHYRFSSRAVEELNASLFAELVRTIEQAGSVPIVILMQEYSSKLVKDTLARASVHHMNIAGCLSDVPFDRRRVSSGFHFSGLSNKAIARCTRPTIEKALVR